MYSKVIPLHIYTYTYFLRFFSIIGYYKIFSIAPALPWWLSGEVSACNTGDMGSIPGSAMSPGEGTHSSILAWEIPWTKEPGGPGAQKWCKSLLPTFHWLKQVSYPLLGSVGEERIITPKERQTVFWIKYNLPQWTVANMKKKMKLYKWFV